jgi:hypothetical protein
MNSADVAHVVRLHFSVLSTLLIISPLQYIVRSAIERYKRCFIDAV